MLVILLDQSESMGKKTWGAKGEKRIEAAANQVYVLIKAILDDAQNGDKYRERIWISVFRYSSQDGAESVQMIHHGWPDAFKDKTSKPWIGTRAEGGTPMLTAFQKAREYLQERFSDAGFRDRFRHSPPPVVLNITDGEAGEFKESYFELLMKEVQRIRLVETPQGFGPMVFHAHITDAVSRPIFLPKSRDGLDTFGKRLFQMADQIPDAWVAQVPADYRPSKGAFGLITNGNPDNLGKFLFLSSDTRKL
jgi:hypothetical protein